MALIDAVLLDPYRMNVWVADRTAGVAGTGTHNDPYDGSTQAKFDAVINNIVANSNITGKATCVHLGPGIFQTNGHADGVSGGWQVKQAMKIVGSGQGVTRLKAGGGPSCGRAAARSTGGPRNINVCRNVLHRVLPQAERPEPRSRRLMDCGCKQSATPLWPALGHAQS